MIKTKEIPTTKTAHDIYCDECGKFITQSIEWDDGYFSNPAVFNYTFLGYTFEKELCEECRQKFHTKMEDTLLKMGFKK